MRCFLSIGLTICWTVATMAAGADPTAKGDAAIDRAALARLAAMSPAQQQLWLLQLEKRANRAAALAFRVSEEAAKHRTEVHNRLHQSSITWDAIRDVTRQVDGWEKTAIARLAKDYRVRVFAVFRADLHAYAERQRVWMDLQQSWKDAGSPFETQNRLLDWLDVAIRDLKSGSPGPIPQKPSVTVEKLPAVAVQNPVAAPQAMPQPTPQPVQTTQPQVAQQPKLQVMEKTPETVQPQPAKKHVAIDALPMLKIEPNVVPPARATAWIPLHPHENVPEIGRFAPAESQIAKSPRPTPPRLSDFDLPKLQPRPIEPSEPVVSEEVLRQMADSEASQPAEPAPVEPPPIANTEAKQPEPAVVEKGQNDAIEVKIGELSTRIGGCNLAFRALETELDENERWDAAKLEPYMDRLKLLITRRRDLTLFRNALSESQRESVEPLASEKTAVAQFAACMDAARLHVSDKGEADRQAEVDRLEKLSRQLADLTGK
jgi:hypothetical protein